jgi:hypothetical protein
MPETWKAATIAAEDLGNEFRKMQAAIDRIASFGQPINRIILPGQIHGTNAAARRARRVLYRDKWIVLPPGTSPILWIMQQEAGSYELPPIEFSAYCPPGTLVMMVDTRLPNTVCPLLASSFVFGEVPCQYPHCLCPVSFAPVDRLLYE